MNWYYVDAGKQAGPVDDTQLQQLAGSGAIQPETLIWREGMANWQPYREVAGASPTMPSAPPVAGAAPVAVAANETVCAECGRIFDVANTIQFGNLRLCAGCKPVFMQKLAEGAKLNTGAMNYAGFWTRFGAVFVDGILLFVLNTGINLIAGLGINNSIGNASGGKLVLQLVLFLAQIGIAVTYETVMIGKYGATLGKMACKIKVVTADGGRVSYLRAFGRYWSKQLSAIICLAGYIMAAFDDERRALHDRICNTRVVFK
jgi:uncharacterized RDD family membrane protein YckC